MVKSFVAVVKNIQLNFYFAANSLRWLSRFLFWLVVIVSVNVVVFKFIFDNTSSKSPKNSENETFEMNRQNLLQRYNLMDSDSSIVGNECSTGKFQ